MSVTFSWSFTSQSVLGEFAAGAFLPFSGLGLALEPHERTIELQKTAGAGVIAYPLTVTTEIRQRTLFYVTIESNNAAIIVFEELGIFVLHRAHWCPYRSDQSNQYFVATHNLYLLGAIVGKANQDNVAVYMTRYCNYAAEARLLNEPHLTRLVEFDPPLRLEAVFE